MTASNAPARAALVTGCSTGIGRSTALALHRAGLPVYATAAVPLTARGRVVEEAWDVPVTIAGVAVGASDYVIADGSGVVFIGADRAAEVIGAAEEIAAREARMAELVNQGVPISEVMGARYENMLKGNS